MSASQLHAAESAAVVHRLRAERDGARAEAARCAQALAAAEERTGELARLCVASMHLNAAATPAAVASALREIVVNLVGSEEFAVFEVQRDRRTPLVSMGLDGAELDRLAGRLAAGGEHDRAGLAARVPLRAGPRTVAEVAVVALLPHRGPLDDRDALLLDLLCTAGGAALEGARLRESMSARAGG